MAYLLIALVLVTAVVVAGRRLDAGGRRRVWIGSLGVTGAGLSALVGALLGAWELFFVAAMFLLVGLPVALVATVWVYADMRDGLLP